MQGELTHIAVGLQITPRNTNTDSLHWLPYVNETLSLKRPKRRPRYMRDFKYRHQEMYDAEAIVSGDITFEVDFVTLGVFMRSFMAESVITSGDLNRHSFARFQSGVTQDLEMAGGRAMNIVKQYETGSAQLFYDMVVSRMQLDMAAGGQLFCTASMMGRGYTEIAPLTPNYLPSERALWDTTSINLTVGSIISWFYTDQFVLKQLTLNDDRKVGPHYTPNTQAGELSFPDSFRHTDHPVANMSGVVLFENFDLYHEFKNQTSESLIFQTSFLTQTEIFSSWFVGLQMNTRGYFNSYDPLVSGPGPIEVPFDWLVGNQADPSYVLINTHTAYT